MILSLPERLRKAAATRFQLSVYDDAGRHAVKDDVLAAADLIEELKTSLQFAAVHVCANCNLQKVVAAGKIVKCPHECETLVRINSVIKKAMKS